jgi:hypothetical protein
MIFKLILIIVHDIVCIAFMIGGIIMLFYGESIGAVIFLLAMIADSVYRRPR